MFPPGSLEQAIAAQKENPIQLTDSQAAAELPHEDLGRAEALELMQAVFGPELQSPAGPFDDLHIEKFLSDHSAVIAAGNQPGQAGVAIGGLGDQYDGATVISSTVPLRTENASGEVEAVDLGLEQSEGEIQPSNPLVEVGIPQELGEGIEIPGVGIQIDLAGAPEERSPSTVEQSVAVYPNVSQDTDLAVAPMPTGLETMTALRSPDAPTTQTLHLDLPQGASLKAGENGGAVVLKGEETLMSVLPPTAIDAAGAPVPVTLEVSGDSLSIHASPEPSASFPIMVDPIFTWNGTHSPSFADWTSATNTSALTIGTQAICNEMCPSFENGAQVKGATGLDLIAKKGAALTNGSLASWSFYVPRYESDIAQYGTPPQSFITKMTLQSMLYWGESHGSYYPALINGIWDQTAGKYTSTYGHGGSEGNLTSLGTSYIYGYGGDQNAKRAIALQLFSGEARTMGTARETYLGQATIELGDEGKPGFGSISSPTPWMNSQAVPIEFTVTDAGLGVNSIAVFPQGGSGHSGWTTNAGCASTPSSPCPRTWKSTDVGRPVVAYSPSTLPTGEDWLEVQAADPVGNSEVAKVKVKVDHAAPNVVLSGSMTEQRNLGISRPHYDLKVSATDGTTAQPQSGVASTTIKVDGKVVDSTSPGCSTQNCSITREWSLNSASYAVGKHTVEVIATDGLGLTKTETLPIEIQRDTTAPTLNLSSGGRLVNGPGGWVEQETYGLTVGSNDLGYGVTYLALLIDGKALKTVTQSCPNGGCSSSLNTSINMASYKGGAHSAEFIAKDAAGNTTKKVWTINVDPKGKISSAEAIQTLEAAEGTTEETPVAATDELLAPEQIAAGDNPGLQKSGGLIESTGVTTSTVIDPENRGGFKTEGEDGPIELTPVTPSGGTDIEVASGVAAVESNVVKGADLIVRPEFDGAMTFEAIREASSPEVFSWQVSLSSGQKLHAISNQLAEVEYEDGTEAFLITAESAHDATGAAVPTKLQVQGSILTLTVEHHSGSYVYPVLAGQRFRSSYVAPEIIEPTPPEEESEETEGNIAEPSLTPEFWLAPEANDLDSGSTKASITVGPPAPILTSGYYTTVTYFKKQLCSKAGCDKWNTEIDGKFATKFDLTVERWTGPGCEIHLGTSPIWPHPRYIPYAEVNGQGWRGPYSATKGSGEHLTVWCHFTLFSYPKAGKYGVEVKEEPLSLMAYIWPNGFVQRVWRHWDRGVET